MARGPTYYASKGQCIYCGTTEPPLRDEHIVPYSLGGQHVLRAASCPSCEDTTKKFEQDVARGLWGDARTSFNAPTRRKRERGSHVDVLDADDLKRKYQIPAHECPAGFVFYKMGDCGFLRGLPPSEDISAAWEMVVIDDESRRKAYKAKHGRDPVLRFKHVPHSFARMLAKIGYCQVLSALDPGDFRPLVLPFIQGQLTNLSWVIGSREGTPEPENGYRLSTLCLDAPDTMYLMAEVRLYSNTHAPTYHVLVGDVIGSENIRRIEAKLFSSPWEDRGSIRIGGTPG